MSGGTKKRKLKFNHWYERLTGLFVAAIMASTVAVFEGYWWPESFDIAYYSLICGAIIHLFIPVGRSTIKLVLAFMSALLITLRFARFDSPLLFSGNNPTEEGVLRLLDFAVQLHPFIWIGMALLFGQLVFSAWAVTRPRVFGLIGAALIILTVTDSFTPIWLWDNVALVVCFALLWLVADHLSQLQRKHPDSWSYLMEYPLRLIAPTVIVLSALMIAGLNMPSLAPMLQDPYTLWKNARGESVEVFLGEKAVFNNTEPLTSGNASSGYSRDDSVLGGGFDFDHSTMMTVTTTHRSYWRGETKGLYTGQGWDYYEEKYVNSISAEEVAYGGELEVSVDRSLAETIMVDQMVTMVREDRYPVLFSATPVSIVHQIGTDEQQFPARLLQWLPDTWEVRMLLGDDRAYPQSYSVTSEVTVLDEEGLRQTNAKVAEGSLHEQYLQLPESLPQRVRDLAAEITAEAATDYDKAKLLESHLRLNYSYNNKPDLSKLPEDSGDFVDGFLFELQEGYCDYFSTAMAVMARSVGLPARWVKGFTPGVLPIDAYLPELRQGLPEDEVMDPDGAGTYTVRNSDAHSWVEIYFEGYGWIPFEATAGFSFPYSTPEGAAPLEPSVPEHTEQNEQTTAEEETQTSSAGSRTWTIAGFAALVLALAAWIYMKREKLRIYLKRLERRTHTANERVVMDMNRLLRKGVKHGMRREEHETLREAVFRWSGSYKWLKDDLLAVLQGFERAKYSGSQLTHDEADQFSTRIRQIILQLK
ncbi:DUF3488 and transglutaminase-like domain-containing protein [Paenibacillus sp. J5C_2022]|uniref:transglutaminase TgpA family protein n=1 Tax=Paenibacillus sp. J5C2022 TaxID=2977129 RepID=UPI0021CEFBFD|nr:DUF3488 and transglutaminase-like domain-containing protein [Paenibacillus sp. J5C2022]MCU6709551.1 DUF3488 and transglutaminase-like domain-containing protein [Paenibacillus sp. J5C2022]